MTKWKNVANIFDVELEEEFVICKNEKKYKVKITNGGLMELKDNEWMVSGKLNSIISGEYEIENKPYKPHVGELYFYYTDGTGMSYVLSNTVWEDTISDLINFYIGNCFRSENEARKGQEKLFTKLERAYYKINRTKDTPDIPSQTETTFEDGNLFDDKLFADDEEVPADHPENNATENNDEISSADEVNPSTIIYIWEPKYSTQSVLIATWKVVKGINRIIFTKANHLKDYVFDLDGDTIKTFPTQPNGNGEVYVVPISVFEKRKIK